MSGFARVVTILVYSTLVTILIASTISAQSSFEWTWFQISVGKSTNATGGTYKLDGHIEHQAGTFMFGGGYVLSNNPATEGQPIIEDVFLPIIPH